MSKSQRHYLTTPWQRLGTRATHSVYIITCRYRVHSLEPRITWQLRDKMSRFVTTSYVLPWDNCNSFQYIGYIKSPNAAGRPVTTKYELQTRVRPFRFGILVGADSVLRVLYVHRRRHVQTLWARLYTCRRQVEHVCLIHFTFVSAR